MTPKNIRHGERQFGRVSIRAKTNRQERIPPYGNFVEHVSIRAKTKKKNPVINFFKGAFPYAPSSNRQERIPPLYRFEDE